MKSIFNWLSAHSVHIGCTGLLTMYLIMFSVIFNSCHKENEPPSIIGKWETVQAFGIPWEHEFKKDEQTCRRSPETFGNTAFCYDYKYGDLSMTMTIYTNEIERWKWSFVGNDIADIVVTFADSTVQRYILKRIN